MACGPNSLGFNRLLITFISEPEKLNELGRDTSLDGGVDHGELAKELGEPERWNREKMFHVT